MQFKIKMIKCLICIVLAKHFVCIGTLTPRMFQIAEYFKISLKETSPSPQRNGLPSDIPA